MTVLVEQYWREISAGLAEHSIPVRHFVLHADQDTLRARIENDRVLGPGPSRSACVTWSRTPRRPRAGCTPRPK
ncbi:hypothetical protein GCM10020229_51490 [Kitasatospora albolonga]